MSQAPKAQRAKPAARLAKPAARLARLRCARLLSAIVAAVALSVMASAPSSGPAQAAQQSSQRASIAIGPGSLRMLGQSSWVGPGQGQFEMDLAITAPDPAEESLEVVVYPELITRSEFQFVLAGNFPEPYYQSEPVPLDRLKRGPGGGAEVDVPVNSSSGGLSIASTGVYPVQVLLQRQGLTQGKPLTTFLVYVGAGATSFKRLDVAMVVPLVARVPVGVSGSLGQVPPAQASVIEADAADLAQQRVAVSVEAPPWVLEALERGPARARAAVRQLAESVKAGDELLPGTWLPTDVGSLVASGLQGYLSEQLSAGSSELASLLGAQPSMATWALPGKVAPESLAALVASGMKQVVLPGPALSPLPSAFQRLTFAQPAKLEVGGSQLWAMGADSELSQRISAASAPGQAVLVANQVLAELAMIDLEAPSDQRGVVLLPERGTPVNPQFLSVLLSGLRANPLLSAVSLSAEFSSVPPATSGAHVLVRHLVGVAGPRPLAGSSGLFSAQHAVAEAGAVFGATSALVRGLSRELLVSSSSAFSGPRRAGVIEAVDRAAERELHELRLPSQSSITLTSRQARLPLTVLSGSRLDAHVRLVMSSEELSFVDATFAAGRCVASNPGSETCTLALSRASTTLQIPVIVRTPGAFQLALEIEAPDGTVVSSGTDTIRSTAVSWVGLLLMVGAAMFLAVWWAKNARHGRRARRLMSVGAGAMGLWERP